MFNEQCEPAFLHRSFPLLSDKGIQHLGTVKIAVAGCGGVGAGLAMTLARMGIKSFHLSDPANFTTPDINRQWGATSKTVGQPKVKVYEEILSSINPACDIKLFPQGCTADNLDEFLEGCDLLIDCLDVSVSYELREKVHMEARKRKMFSVVGPMIGFGCAAVCSSPESMSMMAWISVLKHTKTNAEFPDVLKKIYMPEHLDIIGKTIPLGRVASLAVAPVIAISLLATEVIAYFLDGIIPGSRKPVVLPRVLFFDLYRMSYYIVDVGKLLKDINQEVD